MTRSTHHRASVRQTRNTVTTTVHKAPAQDDFLPPRTWLRASRELFVKMLMLKPDARRVLAVLFNQMTFNRDRVDLTQAQIVQLSHELADASHEDDPMRDLRMLDKVRVSRAAAELRKADIAKFSKKGGFWTINPFLVQFGNVLDDPEFAAMILAQSDYDNVPFPDDNGQQTVRAEGGDTDTSTASSRDRKEASG